MSTAKPVILAGLIAATTAWTAAAQAPLPTVPPINNWTYQRHASTPIEGYYRGAAAAMEAAGHANYLNSVAAVNYQEAVRRRIENASYYVRTYYENKEVHREYREKYAPVPPTKEQWARITEKMLPDRLTAQNFDPNTGGLVWPHVLRTDEYKAIRERIDELVANRSPENSGDGSPSQRQIAELVDAMLALLKSNMHHLSTSQYVAAKEFLRSLDYEMTFPLQSGPLANEVAANQAW
ncbi:MAG: hypothetical protein KatS3mg111_2783 [Pirellulaceae bacterium]|nr:MAG: hypothetical protein KatS3mg111_2783 [Pirellulaceae bacterium]